MGAVEQKRLNGTVCKGLGQDTQAGPFQDQEGMPQGTDLVTNWRIKFDAKTGEAVIKYPFSQ